MSVQRIPTRASIRAFTYRIKEVLSQNEDVIDTTEYLKELANHNFDFDEISLSLKTIDIEDFTIRNGEISPKERAKFARKFHEALDLGSSKIGSDDRLWFSLTHGVGTFLPIPNPKYFLSEKYPRKIKRRDLLDRIWTDSTKQSSKSKHMWASFWWSAELTRSEDYRYTETLFASSDLHLSLMDRKISRNKNLRYAVLAEFDSIIRNNDSMPKSALIQDCLKQVSRLCQGYPLYKSQHEIQNDDFFKSCFKQVFTN